LKAKVNPEGSATTYYFIYKKVGEVECEDLEGCGPSTPHGGRLTGDAQQEVQAEVTGLTPGTTYIYWLIARNASPEAVRSKDDRAQATDKGAEARERAESLCEEAEGQASHVWGAGPQAIRRGAKKSKR
jgi:hypothetical protein